MQVLKATTLERWKKQECLITFEMQFTGDDQGEEEMVVEETARAELNDTPMPSQAFGEDFERRVSVANAHYCNGFNQTSKACTVL